MDDAVLVQLMETRGDLAQREEHLILEVEASLAERLPCSVLLLSIQIDLPAFKIASLERLVEVARLDGVDGALRLNEDALVRNVPPLVNAHQVRVLNPAHDIDEVNRLSSLLLVKRVDVNDCDHIDAVGLFVVIVALVSVLLVAHELAEDRDLTVAALKVQILNQVLVVVGCVQLSHTQHVAGTMLHTLWRSLLGLSLGSCLFWNLLLLLLRESGRLVCRLIE